MEDKKAGLVRVTATTEEWAALCFLAAQAMTCSQLSGGTRCQLLKQPHWRRQAAGALRVVEQAIK